MARISGRRSRRSSGPRPPFVEAVLDAELVVWTEHGGLDFAALQGRARRRGATAEHAARQEPAHLIVFDVLEVSGTVLLNEPLHRRRAVLEELFAAHRLSAPWALCPQTTDRDTALWQPYELLPAPTYDPGPGRLHVIGT